MKIKDKLIDDKLPSKNRHYFSKEPISELFLIIDEIVKYNPLRCDCDSTTRCHNHRVESVVFSINGELKRRIMEVFEDEKSLGGKNER